MKKIKNITIGGFKNLKYTTIELQKITALISPNNYGKSNFLKALEFGIDFLTMSEKGRKNMMAWPRGIPLTKNSAKDHFKFEIEFHDSSLSEYQFVKYGFSFIWFRDNDTGQRIVDEWLEMRSKESVKYSSFLKRNEGKYRKGKSTTAFRNIVLNNFQLAIDTLSSIDDIEYTSVINQIKELSFRSCSDLDAKDRYMQVPFEFEDGLLNDPDSDIPKLLFGLKESDVSRYELFKESILSLFPEFEDFQVGRTELEPQQELLQIGYLGNEKDRDKQNFKEVPFKLKHEEYKIIVKEKSINQPLNLTLLSAGTKRLFWILAVLFSNNSSFSIFGIEELETSIHPRLLKKTLEIINDTLGNVKLLITSHSPYLVQYLKPESIYIGVPNEDGNAIFHTVAQNRRKLLVTASQNNGLSVGEYLFDLMAGGYKSSYILNNYLKK
jgi:predicted ATPase